MGETGGGLGEDADAARSSTGILEGLEPAEAGCRVQKLNISKRKSYVKINRGCDC